MGEAILVGTRGWDHDPWYGGFYPEELPAQWRFAFYSNRLRAVLVPAETWDQVSVAQVRDWLEDCDPGFRFVLELPPAPEGLAAALAKAEPLAAQTAGLVWRPHAPLAAPQELLARLPAALPLCIDWPAQGVGGPMGALAPLAPGRCWRPEDEPEPAAEGRFMLAFLRGEVDGRRQRHILETLAAWQQGTRPAALIFEGGEPRAVRQAEQARVIAELLDV